MGNQSCTAETVHLRVACGRVIRGGGLACCVRDVGSGFRCGFYCLGYRVLLRDGVVVLGVSACVAKVLCG